MFALFVRVVVFSKLVCRNRKEKNSKKEKSVDTISLSVFSLIDNACLNRQNLFEKEKRNEKYIDV